MQIRCSACTHDYMAKYAPCPDGREGCLVAHYDKESFVCPKCGNNDGEKVRYAIMHGVHTELPGIAVYNPKAVARLTFLNEDLLPETKPEKK